MFVPILVALLSLTAGERPATPCNPIPGLEQVLARPTLTYLLFGEFHGTAEMPQLVGDALCAAVETGRPLVLGVELTPVDQPALDLYMASDGTAADRALLLASPGWLEKGGRTTAAIADLIDTARRIGRRHPVTLVAFDTAPEPDTSPRREAAMAAALSSAARAAPRTLVIALTGAGHADKEGWISRKPPFLAAGGRLPPDETLSLGFARQGGQYWGCHAPDGDGSRGCAVYDIPRNDPVSPRGIVLDPKLRGGFDGIFAPGRPYSASPPAVGG